MNHRRNSVFALCLALFASVAEANFFSSGSVANPMSGPASSTDNAVARWDGTSGRATQDSVVIIGDLGEVSGVTTFIATGVATFGSAVDAANTIRFNETTGCITWEGSGADAFETNLCVADPSADRTITLPASTGTVITGGGSSTILDNIVLNFGTGSDASLRYSALQTPDAAMFAVGADSNGVIIVEQADSAFDFAHAAQTNPTLFVHSAAQSTTQWAGVTHDGTDAVVSSGAGAINFTPASGIKIGGAAASTLTTAAMCQDATCANTCVLVFTNGFLTGNTACST